MQSRGKAPDSQSLQAWRAVLSSAHSSTVCNTTARMLPACLEPSTAALSSGRGCWHALQLSQCLQQPPSACSHYGNQEGLKELVAALKAEGIIPVADIVINHRCADEKDEHTGVYNRFRWAAARWTLGVQPGSREQPLDISQKKFAEACRCPICYLVQLPAYSCK